MRIVSKLTVIRIQDVSQSQRLQRCRTKQAKSVSNGDLVPRFSIVERVSEPPCTGNLERDKWEEDPESHFRLVNSVVAFGEANHNPVTYGATDEKSKSASDDYRASVGGRMACVRRLTGRKAHQAYLIGIEAVSVIHRSVSGYSQNQLSGGLGHTEDQA